MLRKIKALWKNHPIESQIIFFVLFLLYMISSSKWIPLIAHTFWFWIYMGILLLGLVGVFIFVLRQAAAESKSPPSVTAEKGEEEE